MKLTQQEIDSMDDTMQPVLQVVETGRKYPRTLYGTDAAYPKSPDYADPIVKFNSASFMDDACKSAIKFLDNDYVINWILCAISVAILLVFIYALA